MNEGRPVGLRERRDVSGPAAAPGAPVRAAGKRAGEPEGNAAATERLAVLGEMAGDIVHEVSTPLQYVGSNVLFARRAMDGLRRVLEAWSEVMRAAEGGGAVPRRVLSRAQSVALREDLEHLLDEVPRALDQAMDGLERISDVVRAVSRLSRPGRGDEGPVDLNAAVEDALTLVRSRARHFAEMRAHLDPHLPPVPGRPVEIGQVVLNLVLNAAQAVEEAVRAGKRERGTVTVSTRNRGRWVEVRVSDTGQGIPDRARARIFQRGFTTRAEAGGSGRGLALVREAVERHGGEVTFRTRTGAGTTFIVRLPTRSETTDGHGGSRPRAGTARRRVPDG